MDPANSKVRLKIITLIELLTLHPAFDIVTLTFNFHEVSSPYLNDRHDFHLISLLYPPDGR